MLIYVNGSDVKVDKHIKNKSMKTYRSYVSFEYIGVEFCIPEQVS